MKQMRQNGSDKIAAKQIKHTFTFLQFSKVTLLQWIENVQLTVSLPAVAADGEAGDGISGNP